MARKFPFQPLAAEPGVWEFSLGDQAVSYRIKKSPKVDGWRLEYSNQAGLVIILPHNSDISEVPAILAEKEGWIRRRLDEARARREREALRRPRDGGQLLFRGEGYEIRCDGTAKPRGRVRLDGRTLVVNVPAGDNAALAAALRTWLRRQAQAIILPMLAAEAAALKVQYRRVFFRNQRTRWASCSNAGNLSLNYHIVMAPPDIVRYLLIHELIHLRTLRHGKRFRQLLAKHYPNYRAAEKWLRENEVFLDI